MSSTLLAPNNRFFDANCIYRRIYSPTKATRPDKEVRSTKETKVKVKRMNLNVPVELHDAFKAATAAQGQNMTDVLIEFVEQYVAKNGVRPTKKGRR
jgi:hypothetical protein